MCCAAEVAAKLIKPGNTNQQVTDAVAKVAKAFDVNAVQGTLMHQMKRCVASPVLPPLALSLYAIDHA